MCPRVNQLMPHPSYGERGAQDCLAGFDQISEGERVRIYAIASPARRPPVRASHSRYAHQWDVNKCDQARGAVAGGLDRAPAQVIAKIIAGIEGESSG